MIRNPIKNEHGKIIGFIEELDNGDLIGKGFYGNIVGKYHKDTNKTHDFYGRIVGKGNILSALIWQDAEKREAQRNKRG